MDRDNNELLHRTACCRRQKLLRVSVLSRASYSQGKNTGGNIQEMQGNYRLHP